MYYKLPVKERMDLMKSYRKANPDMSYQDMVKDYNSSYEKFNNGGKKEINLNLKNQESNTPLSTWNQNTDWLGEKYNDVGLNFNKNNLNIGIGNYVPRSTFEKVGNINPYLNVNYNLNDKSSIGGSFSKDYNGISFIQKFGNGGTKKVEPYQPKSQADYLFRQKMYNDSLALSKYTDIQKALEPKGSSFNFENPDESNKKRQGLLQNYAAKIIKENPDIKYYMDEGIPYKGEYGKLPEKVGEYNKYLASPDLTHPLIKPTGTWEGAASNDNYVKPVQKILPYNKPKIEEKSKPTVNTQKESIITHDKNDPRLRAYNDSLNLHKATLMQDKLMGTGSKRTDVKMDWTTKQLQENRIKKIVPGLESLGPLAADFQNEHEQFYNKKGVKEYNFSGRKEDEALIKYYKSLGFTDKNIMYHSSPDIVHDKIKPIYTYHDGNALSPYYKKPVQPYKYEPEPEAPPTSPPPPLSPPLINPPPIRKDTVQYVPKQPIVNSDTLRHWNFNGPNPVMEYYDKSGKLINKEYYDRVNGKKIEPITK